MDINYSTSWINLRLGIYFFSIWLDVNNHISYTSMFQRSGAILVIAAAITEFFTSKERLEYPYYKEYEEWARVMSNIKPFVSGCRIFGWLSLISGTLIWSYGDFIFCWEIMHNMMTFDRSDHFTVGLRCNVK